MIGIKEYPGYCNLILNSQADMTLGAMETMNPIPANGMYTGNNLLPALPQSHDAGAMLSSAHWSSASLRLLHDSLRASYLRSVPAVGHCRRT
jgi:hypothetical protein